jgi:hypothetical protein
VAGLNEFPQLPNVSLHRKGVTAADAAIPTDPSFGVDCYPFRWAIIQVHLRSGSLTDLDLEILYWNPLVEKFVPNVPAQTILNLTGSASVPVEVFGRRAYVKITSITGTSPVVDIGISNPNVG